MSAKAIQETIKASLENYFQAMGDQPASDILAMIMNIVEKPVIEVVLQQTQGNQSKAAQILGINRNTLYKKMQQHDL